jgi:electron transfer flavoprotein beta subunit
VAVGTSEFLPHNREVNLNSVVCIKQVPDSAAKVSVTDGKIIWGDAPLVMNPWDEFAVETALLMQEEHGGEVIVLSVGEQAALEAIKSALAMGCTQATLISDAALAGADSGMISSVLAAAIRKLGNVDMAVFGKQAIDGDMGITGPQVARLLGWPLMSLVSRVNSLDPAARTILVERNVEEGRQIVEAQLPALITVSKDIAEPRYPSFINIRKAAKAEVPVWSLADLDVEIPAAAVKWPEVSSPPGVEVSTEIIDAGSSQATATELVDRILDNKVLL